MTAQTVDLREVTVSRAVSAQALPAAPRLFPLALFVLGAVALFFAMIFFRISLDEAAFELDAIQDEMAVQESLQLDLRYDLAGLQDPIRIVQEAARIGLVFPSERIAISASRPIGTAPSSSAVPPVSALSGTQP